MEFTLWKRNKKFILGRTNCNSDCDIVNNMFKTYSGPLFTIEYFNEYIIKNNHPYINIKMNFRYKGYKHTIVLKCKKINTVYFEKKYFKFTVFPFKLTKKETF